MNHLTAKIKNLSYKKYLTTPLDTYNFSKDINSLPPKCLLESPHQVLYALSKWVSPKRTRSYPYARVYDTLNLGKVITIIPIIKDERVFGDIDYLQWDTISLMSLLNVYVIIAYYSDAEINKAGNKITSQKLPDAFIKTKLTEIFNYQTSALHWNLNQLKTENLNYVMQEVTTSYTNIALKTAIPLHNFNNLTKFKKRITKDITSFMTFSRDKASKAQNRESLTIQPKELLSLNNKSKLTIENYLGGYYFFTIDSIKIYQNIYFLLESKHSKISLIPSIDDIKDGLVKMMLYANLAEVHNLQGSINFMPLLKLTSSLLQGEINSTTSSETTLYKFFSMNNFNKKQQMLLNNLMLEAKANDFLLELGHGVSA